MNDNDLIEYMKEVLTESNVELPTTKLQMLSLLRFMNAAGYEPINKEKPSQFRLSKSITYFPIDVNFSGAVMLHNSGFFIKNFPFYQIPAARKFYAATNVYFLHEASSQRIVEEVYLQWSKERKDFIAIKNKIKFVEE